MEFRDIDWNRLWQENRKTKSWRGRKKSDWDRRAPSFARRNLHSDYVERFLALLRPEASWRVLDVGAGPGTLAIPLAGMVCGVTAVDFSARMLAALREEAEKAGLVNIHTVQAAWEDDWSLHSIEPHEVAVASRSLSVDDLGAALAKLHRWATKRVVVSDRVGAGPFDPDLFAAVGRDFSPGPDYIYTVNLLYQMGIHATVDFVELERCRTFQSREEVLDSCRWMLDELSSEEEERLAAYVDERLTPLAGGAWSFCRRTPVRWAVIRWDKE
ncbi:MAG: class I SAM-dependent methyltransferase [Desulfobulbaceae bacterium]|nr:class I SAM-dependent methyltransferase [Desulfobulbaceae bacterium]